ncbi:MAG: hypothetical protein QOE85_1657, partial [Actinomycetota bacterium]|nr:hypothetical protein [Actinomycetota bacterium]
SDASPLDPLAPYVTEMNSGAAATNGPSDSYSASSAAALRGG